MLLPAAGELCVARGLEGVLLRLVFAAPCGAVPSTAQCPGCPGAHPTLLRHQAGTPQLCQTAAGVRGRHGCEVGEAGGHGYQY